MTRLLLAALLLAVAAGMSQLGVFTDNLLLTLIAILPLAGAITALLAGDRQ